MADLVRLLTLAPQIVELGVQLRRAGQGDPAAAIGLPEKALTVADTVRPGLGPALKQLGSAATSVLDVLAGRDPTVIEAEYQEVPPWTDFGRHLYALDWGVIVILGAKGEGKTTVGTKILWRFAQKGYIPEFVGVYPEDLPPWGRKISMRRLVARTRKVAQYLDTEDPDSDDDGLTPEDLAPRKKEPPPSPVSAAEIARFHRRAVFVDEAALFFSAMSAAGQQQSRESARNLNNQARHLQTIFVFACQRMSEMPTYLQDTAILIYKYAGEEVIRQDYRSGLKREYSQRWTEVLNALHAIQTGALPESVPEWYTERMREALRTAALCHARYYVPPVNHRRAWSYVVAADIGGHQYRGICPWRRWEDEPTGLPLSPTDETSEEDDDGEEASL